LTALIAGGFALFRTPLLEVHIPPRAAAYARIPRATVEGRIVSHSSPKRGGERFWVRVDRTGPRHHRPVRILAYLSRRDLSVRELRPGMRVRLTGRLRFPLRASHANGFDEAGFLSRRRAAFVMHARRVEVVDARLPLLWKPWAWGESLHRGAQRFLSARFSPYAASVYEGLLLGFRGRMKSEDSRAIQRAGVMHLLTPSGAKVTAVWAWALACGLLLTLGPGARWAFAAAVATLYILVVGFEPPFARAYLMGLVIAAGRWLDRRPGPIHAAALSALLLLIARPQALFSPGFQLTYLAILGILIAIPRWGANPLSFVLVVQAALVPPFASFFGEIPVAGLLANLICVPLSVPVAGLGFLAWIASSLPGDPGAPAVWILERAAEWFRALCRWAGSRPWSSVPVEPLSPARWGFYYAGLGVLFLRPGDRRLSAAGAAAVALCFLLPSAEPGFAMEFRSVRAPLEGRAVSLRKGRLAVSFEPWGAVVGLGGKDVYCVRTAPSEKGLLRCPLRRTFSTYRDGPIRLTFDGLEIRLEDPETGDPLSGFVP
jgi:competence protein ComEC